MDLGEERRAFMPNNPYMFNGSRTAPARSRNISGRSQQGGASRTQRRTRRRTRKYRNRSMKNRKNN